MKIAKGLIALATVALLAGVFYGMTTHAQDAMLTQEHKQRIVANCTSAKSSLRQLHRNDASIRVNRGQLYEFIGTKLMARLNSRLVLNRLDAGKLVDATARYDRALTSFRLAYKAYEEKLSSTLRIDCSKEPEAFYFGVIDARTKRATVYQRATDLKAIINEYYKAFDRFSQEYETATERVDGDA